MNKMIEMFFSKYSWTTTLFGISTILVAIGSVGTALFDGNLETEPQWAAIVTALTAGGGLLFARSIHK